MVSEICDAARGQRRAALRRSIGCPILRDGYYGLATLKAVASATPQSTPQSVASGAAPAAAPETRPAAPGNLTEAIRAQLGLTAHIYEVDPLRCRRCGGNMQLIAFITERAVIVRILEHLGEPSSLSDLKEIGCKSAWTVHIPPLSWAIEELLPFKIDEI